MQKHLSGSQWCFIPVYWNSILKTNARIAAEHLVVGTWKHGILLLSLGLGLSPWAWRFLPVQAGGCGWGDVWSSRTFWERKSQGKQNKRWGEGKQNKPWGDGSGSGHVLLWADGSSVLGWFNDIPALLPYCALPTVIPSLPWTPVTCCACSYHWHFTVLGSMMNWAGWVAAGLHPRHLSTVQHFPQADADSSVIVIKSKENSSKFRNSRNLGNAFPYSGRGASWIKHWRQEHWLRREAMGTEVKRQYSVKW